MLFRRPLFDPVFPPSLAPGKSSTKDQPRATQSLAEAPPGGSSMTEAQCSGVGREVSMQWHWVSLRQTCGECQGSRMEVAAPILLRLLRQSFWGGGSHASHSGLSSNHAPWGWGGRKPHGNPARLCAVAARTLTWDESAYQEEHGLTSRGRRGSLTNFKLASTICLAKRTVRPAMMRGHPEATRPNGAQKRHPLVWQLCLAPANLRNPAPLPLLDAPEKVREVRGQSNGTTCPRRDASKVWSCHGSARDRSTSWGAIFDV